MKDFATNDYRLNFSQANRQPLRPATERDLGSQAPAWGEDTVILGKGPGAEVSGIGAEDLGAYGGINLGHFPAGAPFPTGGRKPVASNHSVDDYYSKNGRQLGDFAAREYGYRSR